MSGNSRAPADAVVIGGGPAGAAAARLLATWGHSVVVLTGPTSQRPTLAESLPPSCNKLFDLLGVTNSIERAGFYRSTGNTVSWGKAGTRTEAFAGGLLGYQVLRRVLDTALLDAAEAAGAQVLHGATVRSAIPDTPHGQVKYSDRNGEPCHREGRYLLDCSGRVGVIARHGLRVRPQGPGTMALVGVWRAKASWPTIDPTHTLVESYNDGWAWSVPLSRTLRYCTCMVEPNGEGTREPLIVRYQRELAKTERLRELVAGALCQGEPYGCDASLYAASSYVETGTLLVGDAASFIDPLSSFGVKKALASAWLAAVVLHTCLSDTAMSGAAQELYGRREGRIFEAYRELSRNYFSEAARHHDHPFWSGRSKVGELPSIASDLLGIDRLREEPDVTQLRGDATVQRALDEMREGSGISLHRGGAWKPMQGAAVQGRRIVLEDRIGYPGLPRGLRYLRGVDLPHLVVLASEYNQVPDLYEGYSQSRPLVSLPDFLGVLATLIAQRILVNEP